ncbi:AAA family ATPase [Actinomadura keratinilytica]
MLGPPGTAKSELAREVTGRVEGAAYWEILLSKFTAPTRMFGPVDVGALARGEYRQVFEGRATTAHIAFVDEIFKCSTAALNETLGFLNERLYHPENGGEPIRCPLIGAITASNELPSGEESAAVYDRLLVRIEVGYLADPSNFAALIRSAVTPPAPPRRTTVTLAALQHAVTEEVPAVPVPDAVVDALCTLRAALRRKELIASDRRWRQSVRLLQAGAYLDGRPEVAETDLSVLTHVLWDSPAQRPTVEREVLQLVNPDAREALDLADTIEELEAQLDSMASQSRRRSASGSSRTPTRNWPWPHAPGEAARGGGRRRTLHRRHRTRHRPSASGTRPRPHRGAGRGRQHGPGAALKAGSPPWRTAQGRSAEPGHTGAVVADPYDRIAWRDLYAQSAALRELAAELAARHAHTTDLLADAFLAAYLAAPRVREAAEMAPSRRFNRQVVAELAASPGFAALRRETAGDPYAAALAVLAEAPALRLLLDRTERPGRRPPGRPRPAGAPTACPGRRVRRRNRPEQPPAPSAPGRPRPTARRGPPPRPPPPPGRRPPGPRPPPVRPWKRWPPASAPPPAPPPHRPCASPARRPR